MGEGGTTSGGEVSEEKWSQSTDSPLRLILKGFVFLREEMRREKSWAHLREGIKGRALSFFFLFSFLCLSPSFSKGTEFGGGIGSRRKGWSRRGTRTRTRKRGGRWQLPTWA